MAPKNENLQGEAAPPLAEGRYRLLSVLGVGGMATVYRGYDARLQVNRAIKVLSPALAKRKSLKSRFEAEASTMALLQHRNIVSVHDVGADGNRIFIVMELVEGGSLLDRVRDHGPIPPKMALDVTVRMLDALKVAHKRGVVHRDIKPHNILLSGEGDIRVTDFGIAQMKRDDDQDGLTKTGAVMGTWGFMAPEQRSDAKGVDQRADIYSVGATLYAIMTDKTPGELFAADMDPGMLAGLPDEITTVIRKATRYNREERYADAQAMAEACRAAMGRIPDDPADTPPLASPPRDEDEPDPRNLARRPFDPSRGGSTGASAADPQGGGSFPSQPEAPAQQNANGGSFGGGSFPGGASFPGPPAVLTPIQPPAPDVPMWRQRPNQGETAVPDDDQDISDYLEPSGSEERPRQPIPGLDSMSFLEAPRPKPAAAPAPPPPLATVNPPSPAPHLDDLLINQGPQAPVQPAPASPAQNSSLTLALQLSGLVLLGVIGWALLTRPWETVEPEVEIFSPPPGEIGVSPPVEPPVEDPVKAPETGPAVVESAPPEKGAGQGAGQGGRTTSPRETDPANGGSTTNKDPGAGTTVVKVTPPPDPPVAVVTSGLKHSPPGAVILGKSLALKATLPDDAWIVTVTYRSQDGNVGSKPVRMTGSGGVFTASIPIGEEFVSGVAYFIKAEPTGGGEPLLSGSGFKPHKVAARRE
ncbi:MAG: protein kinase [Deltaproteobacteria bacterium]|nr:protein kinase [Deltaproteobacteria bacterium]